MSLKETLKKHDFNFKKKYGQNFINDTNLLNKIADAAQISSEDIVVEIGPGAATLTKTLAQKAKAVIAIEIDDTLLPIIAETMAGFDNFHLLCADALKVNLDELVAETLGKPARYKVVANLPYYITTPLVMRFLEEGFAIERITIMVQKEVAQRFQAKSGTKDYGAVTVALQYYGDVTLAFVVPRTLFIPQPDVDSAVVDIQIYSEKPCRAYDEALLRRLIKAAFGQRRKTLSNALKTTGFDAALLQDALSACAIDPKRRGETLTVAEFVAIANAIACLQKQI